MGWRKNPGILVDEPLWPRWSGPPSAAVFPGGEGFWRECRLALRQPSADTTDAAGHDQHGHDVLWLASHGDVIRR